MSNNPNRSDFLQLITPEIIPTIQGIAAPFSLHRFDKSNDRYYYQFPEHGDPKGYLSVTSFTQKSLGIGQGLADWMARMGKEGATHYAKQRAAYGTLMHIEITEILKTGKGDFMEIADRALQNAVDLGYKYVADQWQEDIVKDIAAFLVFAKEKELEVIAAEFPLASDEYGLAGCVDLICRLKFNRGKVNAILDFKSGRKGFFDSHELQLHSYKTMWNDWFGEIFPVTHVFNFAPTDWRGTPKYKLQNQTKSVFAGTVRDRMKMAYLEDWVKPPTGHLTIVGKFELDSFDIENHIYQTKIA